MFKLRYTVDICKDAKYTPTTTTKKKKKEKRKKRIIPRRILSWNVSSLPENQA